MLVRFPAYYGDFRCLAGACPDSCCAGWDILVDADAHELYRTLSGAVADRLRQNLTVDEDGQTMMAMVDGRCPMWRQDGLCDLQLNYGEAALCQVCREFPRIRQDYGSFTEYLLELSCPEAARLILDSPIRAMVTQEAPGGDEPDYDAALMTRLLETRGAALALLAQESRTPAQALSLVLLYAHHVQAAIDGADDRVFDPRTALETANRLGSKGDFRLLAGFYQNLEILTPDWRQLLERDAAPMVSPALCRIAAYGVQRYWLQAVSDYDLVCRVKLIVSGVILIAHLAGTQGSCLRTAQLYSKEIENDADNVEAILDAAYTHPGFTDANLLGLLKMMQE